MDFVELSVEFVSVDSPMLFAFRNSCSEYGNTLGVSSCGVISEFCMCGFTLSLSVFTFSLSLCLDLPLVCLYVWIYL